MSTKPNKLREFFLNLLEIIRKESKFKDEFTNEFAERDWNMAIDPSLIKYNKYNTRNGSEFVRFMRDMLVNPSHFVKLAGLSEENLFQRVINENIFLIVDIYECCYNQLNYLSSEEHNLLKKFVRVEDCDYD